MASTAIFPTTASTGSRATALRSPSLRRFPESPPTAGSCSTRAAASATRFWPRRADPAPRAVRSMRSEPTAGHRRSAPTRDRGVPTSLRSRRPSSAPPPGSSCSPWTRTRSPAGCSRSTAPERCGWSPPGSGTATTRSRWSLRPPGNPRAGSPRRASMSGTQTAWPSTSLQPPPSLPSSGGGGRRQRARRRLLDDQTERPRHRLCRPAGGGPPPGRQPEPRGRRIRPLARRRAMSA